MGTRTGKKGKEEWNPITTGDQEGKTREKQEAVEYKRQIKGKDTMNPSKINMPDHGQERPTAITLRRQENQESWQEQANKNSKEYSWYPDKPGPNEDAPQDQYKKDKWTTEWDKGTDKWGPKITVRQRWEHKNQVKRG